MIDGDSVIFLDEPQETGEAIDASSVIFLDEPVEPQQPRGLDFTLPGQQPLSTDGASEPAIPMPQGGAELPIRPGQGLPPEPPKFISQIEQSAPSRKEAERYDYLINDALDNVGGDRGFSLNYDSIKPEHRGWFAGRLAERTREVKPVRQKGVIERGVDAVFDRGVSVGKKGISKTLEAGVELLGLDSFDRPSYEGKKFDDMTDEEKRQFMDKEFQDTLQGLYESNDPVSVWEQAGSMAGQMAPGLAAGAGLGGARQAGTWLSSLLDKGAVANAGYWGTQMFPDMYRELRKSGVSDEKAALVAAPVAFLIGFSENIGMNPANMFKGGTSGLLGRLVGYAKNVAGESFEEVIQTAMERGTTEAFKDSPDYGRVTREALEAFPQSLPAIAVLGLPGGMVRLTQDALNHPDVVKDWIHQNYEMARSIASSESTPSRSVVKDLSDAGVIKSDDFRSLAKRKHLQRQIAAGIQASSVPFRGGQVEALRQEVQPQDAPYQDLPVEQQASEPEQPAQQQFPENQQFPEQENATQQENPPPTDQAQEPPPAEPPTSGGISFEEMMADPSLTSPRKAMMQRDREILGLAEVPSPEQITWREDMLEASRQGIPENASVIASEVNKTPRALSSTETAGLTIRAAELKGQHKEKTVQMRNTTDQAEEKLLASQAEAIESEFESISLALLRSGTEKGRALAAQKITIDQDFDLISVKSRAKTQKGESLTEKQEADLEAETRQHEELQQRVEELERQLKEEMAKDTVSRSRQSRDRKKRRQAEASLPAKYQRLQELFEAGCLGF